MAELFEDLKNKVQDLDNRFQNLKNKLDRAKEKGKEGLGLKDKPAKKLTPIPPKGWKGKKEKK